MNAPPLHFLSQINASLLHFLSQLLFLSQINTSLLHFLSQLKAPSLHFLSQMLPEHLCIQLWRLRKLRAPGVLRSTVKYSVKSTPSQPAGVDRTAQSWSRAGDSASSDHSRLLPHDHTGSSSAGTHTHNPEPQKKKCAVM
ncbi:hypothetical protein F2P79_021072 [Pimephales promelas]|nr:hypothetical protein F2P79_021072 [Pimephales promelas]